jgi:TRAP-type C4-dicarboxylate transport system, large permease component
LLPVFVLGGILFGIVTVTEASVVAAVYAFLVATFVYRKLTWKTFYRSLVNASIVSATVLFIVATAAGVAWVLTSAQVPQTLARQLQALTASPLVFLLLANIFLLIVGAVMDLTPALLILGPILFPIAIQYGLSPIHFGVVMVTNLAIGLVTPPVGSCLYLTVGFAGCSVTKIIRASFPFLAAQILVLLLITYLPPLVTWLPGLL